MSRSLYMDVFGPVYVGSELILVFSFIACAFRACVFGGYCES